MSIAWIVTLCLLFSFVLAGGTTCLSLPFRKYQPGQPTGRESMLQALIMLAYGLFRCYWHPETIWIGALWVLIGLMSLGAILRRAHQEADGAEQTPVNH